MNIIQKFKPLLVILIIIFPASGFTKSKDLKKYAYSYLTIDGGYTHVTGSDWNTAGNSYALNLGFGHKFQRSRLHFGPEIHINVKHSSQNESINADGESIISDNSFLILGVGPAFKYIFQYKTFPVIPFLGFMPGVYLRKGDIETENAAGSQLSKSHYRYTDIGTNVEGGIGYILTPSVIIQAVLHYSMIIEPRKENMITWYTPALRLYFRF